jgi:Ras family protein A
MDIDEVVHIDQEKTIELGLLDTNCHEELRRLRPLNYIYAHTILLCFSVGDPDSFEHVEQKWLPEIYHHHLQIPIILIACQTDIRSNTRRIEEMEREGKRVISTEEGQALAQRIEARAYIECSAVSQTSIEEVLHTAALVASSFRNPTTDRKGCRIL